MQKDQSARVWAKSDANAMNWFKDQALDHCYDVLMLVDPDYVVVYANQAAVDLFSQGMVVPGNHISETVGTLRNRNSFMDLFRAAAETGHVTIPFSFIFPDNVASGDLSIYRKSSEEYGTLLAMVFRDNSSYIRLQQRLTHDEFFDRSSGLMNQRALDIMVEKELQLAETTRSLSPGGRYSRSDRRALIMIQIANLEHLKSIYPSETINQIFEYLGNTIHQSIKAKDFVFRYDESRIVILLIDFKVKAQILEMAERLADQLAVPFHPRNVDIHFQTSMGITIFPDDGHTKDALLGNVAAALNYARETDQPWLVYSRDIHRLAVERLLVRSGLSKAVKRDELELRYMVLLNRQGEVKGLEALIRWRHPQRGLLSPDKFLPVAISSKIIGALSRWVLYRIVEDYERHFKDLGIFITLNISAIDLDDLYLPGCIETAIHGRMPASALKIEITESECMENFDRATLAIQGFQQRGIEILIDDFGVGQSSLAYLKDLQAHYAKIDHSFAREVETSPTEKEFISHMIALCHLRGLKIIVEGIETPGQFSILSDCGADLFQGHYFGKPMTMEELKDRYFKPRTLQSLSED